MVSVAKVSLQHHRSTIDLNSLVEVHRSFIVLFLLLVYITKTEPCVVMSLISIQSLLITFPGLVEILVLNIFMTT